MKKLSTKISAIILCLMLLTSCGKPAQKGKLGNDLSSDNVQYVLIYNPELYNENNRFNDTLGTGDISKNVDASIFRADGELADQQIYTIATNVMNSGFDFSGFEYEESKGSDLVIPYAVGDVQPFYHGSELDTRVLGDFTCRYAGEYCNVWTIDPEISEEETSLIGTEFDEKIYETLTETFGESRFSEEGGKANILLYEFDDPYCAGFFFGGDSFRSSENAEKVVGRKEINKDHDIINVNSLILEDKEELLKTVAHEYQHLICWDSYFRSLNRADTWLNEAMSGYTETLIYPQFTPKQYLMLSFSNLIRHGQSLYNFYTEPSFYGVDAGVYDSVYLFSKYLENISDEKVFSRIHANYRDASPYDKSEDIVAKSVSDSAYKAIDDKYNFDKIKFETESEEWMSKLTLDFYLSLLNYDSSDPEAFKYLESQTLLYDEINPAEIEGGGRIIVALKDNKFEIPEDADHTFVYVGLDKDFNVVTELIIN